MKYILVFITVFLISFTSSNAQPCSCGNRMYYYIEAEGFDVMYFPICVNIKDTVKEVFSNGHYYKCVFSDCKGAMTFFGYTDFHLSAKGNFVNSLDTFRICSFVTDFSDPGQPVIPQVLTYFQPLRDGEWIYYDDMGEVIKKEKWRMGVLIESTKVDPE